MSPQQVSCSIAHRKRSAVPPLHRGETQACVTQGPRRPRRIHRLSLTSVACSAQPRNHARPPAEVQNTTPRQPVSMGFFGLTSPRDTVGSSFPNLKRCPFCAIQTPGAYRAPTPCTTTVCSRPHCPQATLLQIHTENSRRLILPSGNQSPHPFGD